MGHLSARAWIAPGVILLSTGAVLHAAGGNASTARSLLVVWFLAVCPGWALVGLLALADRWLELSVAIALSLALDVLVAAGFSYGGAWSPSAVLAVLGAVSVGGAAGQVWRAAQPPPCHDGWGDA